MDHSRRPQRAATLAEALERTLRSTSLSSQAALERASELVSEAFASGCLLFFETTGEAFVPVAGAHRDPTVRSILEEFAGGGPALQRSRVGDVLRQGQSLLVAGDPDQLAGWLADGPATVVKRAGMTSLLAVPLMAEGGVFGAVVLTHEGAHDAHTEKDKAALERLAERISPAIGRHRVSAIPHDRSRARMVTTRDIRARDLRRARQLESVVALGRRGARGVDRVTLMREAAKTIASTLEAVGVLILEELPEQSAAVAVAAEPDDGDASSARFSADVLAAARGTKPAALEPQACDGQLPASWRDRDLGSVVVAAIRRGDSTFGWLVVGLHDATSLTDDQSDFVELVAEVLSFVLERDALTELARYRAGHDALTDLPNRANFVERLAEAVGRAARTGTMVGVLSIDLDRFKDVNGRIGHAAGDQLLELLSRRLAGASRTGDTLARLGGDAFGLLCEPINGETGGIAAAERLVAAIHAPFVVDEREVFVSASVGVVVAEGGASDPESLVRDADVAMYRAKEHGGGRYELFDQPMRQRVLERLQIEYDLRGALDRGEFELHYQPLVSLTERRIVGVEALVRWQHPQKGLVAPASFIPVAEASGLIVPLGRWVLKEACRQLARWAADRSIDLEYVSVNVSGAQLAEPTLPEEIADVLRRTGVPPERLALELTESVLMESTSSPTATLQKLESLGVKLMLDDFGTGYSSLNYVKRFPVAAIKVDRSFVAGVADDASDRQILRAIVRMAAGLEVDVVAEGVETLEQATWLARLGCQLAQGYGFARPAPAAVIEPLLRDGLPPERLRWSVEAPPADDEAAVAAEPDDAVADAGRTVPLREAAHALGVSTSTLRRWADSGRIDVQRTAGGHRRFSVSEVRRVSVQTAGGNHPVVRTVALPTAPLLALGDVLERSGLDVVSAAAQLLYERPGPGWFVSEAGLAATDHWKTAVTAACRSGDYGPALDATSALAAQADYGGASLLELFRFVERAGELAARRVQAEVGASDEVSGTRRLFARLRESVLGDDISRR